MNLIIEISRDKLFGKIIGRLEFGYLFDGTDVVVKYYVNREPQNDWFDWVIQESKEIIHLTESHLCKMVGRYYTT